MERPVGVSAHHRSGTNFLQAACRVNFTRIDSGAGYHNLDPSRLAKHLFPRIYIVRPWRNVAESLWRMRERFGAGAASLEEFENTPWSKQWKIFPPALYAQSGSKRVPTSSYYKNIDLKPQAYHDLHIKTWTAWSVENPKQVMVIQYLDLVGDYQETMLGIAEFLGSDKKQFKTIDKKVGIWKKGDGEIHGI